MIYNRKRSTTLVACLLGLFGSASTASAGMVTYHVVVNTSSIAAGTNGSLEFQYNPAMTPTSVSSAVVSNFTTVGGVVSPTTEVTGNVTGDLAHLPMTLTGSTPLNDILEDFKFGSSFAFDVTLSGTAAPSDRFSLTVWPGDINAVDAGTVNPVLSIPNDPSGAALTIDYTGVTATVINASPQVTAAAAVPEPSSLALMAVAGTCLLARRRCVRRGRAA